MKYLRIGLLATVMMGVGFVGVVQAHDFERNEGWHGAKTHQGHRASKRHAHSRGDHGYRHYLDKRQARQQRRIEQGWHSGELTRKELKRLRKNQRRIARLERRFASDGHFSRKERRAMTEALDEASSRIYRKKHNDRYRIVDHRDRHDHRHGEVFGLWSDGVGFVWYDLDS